MAEYNNSAGRILEVYAKFGKLDTRQTINRAEAATALGVPDEWHFILAALADLRLEMETLCEDVLQFRDNPKKYQLYKQHLPGIRAVLDSFLLNIDGGSVQVQVSNNAIFTLTFIASDLPQEESPTDDEVNRIRKLVDELRTQIESATELTQSVRAWLLDLVRIIRDSLDRYSIRGSRGMRQQFALLVGELMLNWDNAQKIKEQDPSLWAKVTEAMDLMNRVASLHEKYKPAITFVQQYLPVIKGVALLAFGHDPNHLGH